MTKTARGNAALILLARLDSRRLPGKGLKDLGGRPVLGRAMDRLRRCREVSDIVVATTARPVDDDLAAFSEKEGIPCYRGSSDDVAGRCLSAMKELKLDWFVRICGDSPFVDPGITDRIARTFLDGPSIDIATNVFPRGYPIGASAEAVSRDAIERICAATDDVKWLEHVTAWAYEHPADFNIANVAPENDRYQDLSIAVDTPEDLEKARNAVTALEDPAMADLDAIVRVYR